MTRLVFVGGFLGAGKTTTLLRLARDLVRAGHSVGVLTNDQGQELVDTELFRASGLEARDVRGGCFCCRLDEFIEQAGALGSMLRADYLLAEPVGSCTDLVATVLRPLRQFHPNAFRIGPFTVLVDPLRARDALSPVGKARLSEKITYIYRLQQLEADAIAINKIDALSRQELVDVAELLRQQVPGKRVLTYSARTGERFDELAAFVLGPTAHTVSASPAIDYDVYAEGEAELAWFDGSFDLLAREPVDMDSALLALGSLLRDRLALAHLEIAHVKLLLSAGEATSVLSIPRGDALPELSRTASAQARSLLLLVNARVAAKPGTLRDIVEECLGDWAEKRQLALSSRAASAFSPARPVPTRRIA